ncbi:MAG TPA: RebB family R body protein [Thermoanaerobaculia bacterium]|nr:RebB family R body protein [Thermoanaerobaculia bacterium]
MPDTVNPQITDAVTQTNVKVLAEAPAQSLAVIYQVLGQTISLSMQNGASSQQSLQTLGTAATARAVELIMAGSAGT